MASTVRDDASGSSVGFAIVFLTFVFRGFLEVPSWIWWALLAAGVLLAVKDGITGLDLITLGLAAWMVFGSLLTNVATIGPPDLKLREPIPVPAEYGFQRDDSDVDPDVDSSRVYRSRPIRAKMADAAVAEVVTYYVNGLAPEWRVLDRTEDQRSDTPVVRAKFRQGETSNGIGIEVYALVSGEDRSAVVILMIQALNCGEDVPGLPAGEVCWQGPV